MADDGLRDRLARQGEDALGKLAQDLLENPLVNSAISRAFGAREKAGQAQEAALGALNIPSAADIERVTRRLRSVSQRLESIEDTLDRVEERLAKPAPKPAAAKKPAARKPAKRAEPIEAEPSVEKVARTRKKAASR